MTLFSNQNANKKVLKTKKDFFIGFVLLVLMVIPCSIIGPLTVMFPAEHIFVKATWRTMSWAIVPSMILYVMYSLNYEGYNFRKDFSTKNILKAGLLSFFMNLWMLGYIIGCSMTVTSHADIMYCSSGVWIFFITILIGGVVHRLEVIGYVLYFLGTYFMFTDHTATKTGMDGQSYLGDLYAFLGAGSCVVFAYLGELTQFKVPMMARISLNFIFWTLFQLMLYPLFVDWKYIFSFDPKLGAFGWLTDSNAFFLNMLNGFVTGVLGNIGFYGALDYFTVEIATGAMLLEPLFAEIAGVMFGQDEIPGFKTVLGCLIISAGFLLAGSGANQKQKLSKIEPEVVIPELIKQIEPVVEEEFSISKVKVE